MSPSIEEKRGGVRRSRMGVVDAVADEEVVDLADRMHRHSGVVEGIEMGARWRQQREVAAARRPLERSGTPAEGTRDHPAHGIRPAELDPGRGARLLEIVLLDDIPVRGELDDRVHRGVRDQLAGAHVVLAMPLDRGQSVEDLAPAEAVARGRLEAAHQLRREPVLVCRQRLGRDDAHELPVA